jgi:hypothetical protein
MGSFSEDSSEKNKLIIGIWAGVSSNDALSSPARTKRLLRRLPNSRSAYSLPAKKPKPTTSLTTKPYLEFNFRHKFSLLVVGASQRGKTYILPNKFWKTIVLCTRSKEVSACFGATINGKIVTTT